MQKYPTLQHFPWSLSLEAVKESEKFSSYMAFYQHLQKNLPINSPQTRVKYSNVIQRRFFPNRSLSDFAPLVWKAYHDDAILREIMRTLVLETESLIGDFAIGYILMRKPGSELDVQVIKDYIINAFGILQEHSYRRLTFALKEMGFLGRYNKSLFIEPLPIPADSFLILLHERLAPAPRIVRLSEILDVSWWRYLGLQDELQVRDVLHQAEASGLISRFSKVDELEQITTRYTREEYFQKALKL